MSCNRQKSVFAGLWPHHPNTFSFWQHCGSASTHEWLETNAKGGGGRGSPPESKQLRVDTDAAHRDPHGGKRRGPSLEAGAVWERPHAEDAQHHCCPGGERA